MGQWTLLIEGHGIHDNQREDDADRISAAALGALRDAGQEIEHATFTVGARRDVEPAQRPAETAVEEG